MGWRGGLFGGSPVSTPAMSSVLTAMSSLRTFVADSKTAMFTSVWFAETV